MAHSAAVKVSLTPGTPPEEMLLVSLMMGLALATFAPAVTQRKVSVSLVRTRGADSKVVATDRDDCPA